MSDYDQQDKHFEIHEPVAMGMLKDVVPHHTPAPSDEIDGQLANILLAYGKKYNAYMTVYTDELPLTEGVIKEIKQLIQAHTAQAVTAAFDKAIAIVEGNKVDVEATREHMLSKGADESQILDMEIEASDTDEMLNAITAAINAAKEGI